MAITYILVPVDEKTPISTGEMDRNDIGHMQHLVEDQFDVIDVDKPPASLWFGDNSLNLGKPLNRRATLYLWMHAPEYRERSAIMGPAFITGQPDVKGNTKTAPKSLLELLFKTERYKFLMRVPGHPWFASEVHFNHWVDCYDAALSTVTAFPIDAEVKVARAD